MTTQEVADRLVALCRKGDWEQAQEELYHQEITSVEPDETGGEMTKGMDGIKEKNKKWGAMALEVHGWEVSDPLVADGYFSVTMTNDVTLKEIGRIKATELCVYKVEDGEITYEKFYHK